MTTISHTDNLLQKATASVNLTVVPGVWVRLLNNSTATNYYSTAVTDVNGAFTHSAVPGDYSLYYGLAATVIGTPTLVNAHYAVPLTAGDDAALGSVTAVLTSPYSPTAAAGEVGGVVRDLGGGVYNLRNAKYTAIGTWNPVAGTGDATAAIQQAYADANAAGGGVVYFPPGTYVINGMTGLNITTAANITFRGAGWGSSLQISNAGSGTQYMFLTGAATISNLVMEDLDLNILYTGGSWAHIIIGSGTAAGVRFNRVQFRCINYTGAIPYYVNAAPTAARGFTDWHFTKCRFYNPGTQTVNGMIIRGFDGLEVDGCEWVNVNNPIIPDNIFQKYNLRFTNNYEKYTVSNPGVVNMEGFDTMGCEGIVCINNQQWSTVAQSGTSDIGGVLIDTAAGLITDGVVVEGNTFYGNPIQLAPQNGAPITNCIIANNTIWGTRSTGGGVNSCVQLGADAGTSKGITIIGNTCAGPFTGAPIFIGAGYASNAISCVNNPGANPTITQAVTEAVLVSGVTLGLGSNIAVTLTANRVVGAPLNPISGTDITYVFLQNGTGGWTITWNAAFNTKWQAALAANALSTVTFTYDGTSWQQTGGATAVDQNGNTAIQGALTTSKDRRISRQTPAHAASPAPDATLGEIFNPGAMTGNITIANPTNSAIGQRLLMIWTQDGTGGRTITYSGTNWRAVGIAATVTTLSTVTIDEAHCIDGTIWRVNRLVTGQTI